MTFDYARAKATAERLLAKFGQSATLRQQTASGDPWAPTLTDTDTTVTVVDLNRRVRDAAGVLVAQSMRTLYVSTSAGVTPAKADKVQIGGEWHEVAEVRALAPGGAVVFWECDLVA